MIRQPSHMNAHKHKQPNDNHQLVRSYITLLLLRINSYKTVCNQITPNADSVNPSAKPTQNLISLLGKFSLPPETSNWIHVDTFNFKNIHPHSP